MLENERDKYLEDVNAYVETLKWVSSEFRQKAIEMLEMSNHYTSAEIQQDLILDCIDNGTSYLTCADS
jgi:hypothetical protein